MQRFTYNFNDDLSPPKTEYITKIVDVKINKSSTAEDVKLLRELEEIAKNNILDIVFHKLEPIGIEYAELVITVNHIDWAKHILIIFSINGHKVKHYFKWDDWQVLNQRQRIEEIYKLISNEITELLLIKTNLQDLCDKKA